MSGRPTAGGWPSAATRVVGVMGDPVAHSLSPLLHNAAFEALELDWVSVGFAVPAGGAAGAVAGVRALGIAGLSVTMPHKATVAALVDARSPVAERLGAVNCLRWEGGRLIGDNTDGAGLLAALRRGAGFDPDGCDAVVAGAGGAARAVVLALALAGASRISVVNRTPERAAEAAALAGDRGRVGVAADAAGADLVVDATPAGMDAVGMGAAGMGAAGMGAAGMGAAGMGAVGMGAAGAGRRGMTPLVDPSCLGPGQLVVDLVYHPLVTPWLAAAAARGATTVGGLGMLVHQAALQLAAWTGLEPPEAAMWEAATTRVAEGFARESGGLRA